MSREIKFRVWNGEVMSETFHPWEMKSDACGGWMDSFGVGLWYEGCEAHNLKWMQFTGLKDKNGREIYEGDVIEISGGYEGSEVDPTKARVFFKDGAFQTDFHNALIRIALPGNWLVEVIGNIYENPELVQASSTPEGAA